MNDPRTSRRHERRRLIGDFAVNLIIHLAFGVAALIPLGLSSSPSAAERLFRVMIVTWPGVAVAMAVLTAGAWRRPRRPVWAKSVVALPFAWMGRMLFIVIVAGIAGAGSP